ncbi:MAG: T9SS type A sorting domain-containing protein [Dysgonamonadaceae bacterium]|jgi:hypothetical protein|nr:T9SS type A sorting domain-containing protein [Dysgonamonadaceae bacterium]
MKTTILCSTLLLFACQTFAQTFAFFHKGQQLENNAEITVTKALPSESGVEGELVLESDLALKNLTDNYIDTTRMTQTVLTGPTFPAGTISFCFYECEYASTSDLDTYRKVDVYGIDAVRPNELWEPPRFHLSFFVGENLYTSAKVRYEVFPPDNPNDKTTVTITYDYNPRSAALSKISLPDKVAVSQEGDNVLFTYSLDSHPAILEVYNVIGNKLSQHPLKSAKGTLVLPGKLPQGIYLYTLKQGNHMTVARKFIVK